LCRDHHIEFTARWLLFLSQTVTNCTPCSLAFEVTNCNARPTMARDALLNAGGQTHQPIFTQNGLIDVDSRKDVPFGVKIKTF